MSINKGKMPPCYDESFKNGTIKMLTEQRRPSKEVAAELGICIDNLKSWINLTCFRFSATDRQKRQLFQAIEDKYRYVDANCSDASIDKLCRLLEISRRSYYAWKNRGISARKQHEQRLLRILISFHEKHPAAGLDALVHMIKPICPCSRNTLHRLMKLHNIHSIRKRAYKITTNSNHSYAVSPNLLQRNPAAIPQAAEKVCMDVIIRVKTNIKNVTFCFLIKMKSPFYLKYYNIGNEFIIFN